MTDIKQLWWAWQKAAANLEFVADWKASNDGDERDLWRRTRADYLVYERMYRDAYKALPTPAKAREHERRKAERKTWNTWRT